VRNPRIYGVTIVNAVLLAGLFQWSYPESDVSDVLLVIMVLSLSGAIAVNYIFNKYFGSERNNDDIGRK
jgi:protein-S-isoprenylcysteine O-methyltransferase Ste14